MKNGWKREVKRLILVVLGSVIMATNIKCFVQPAGLMMGGVSGISLLVEKIFGTFTDIRVSYAVVNLLLNAVPVIIGFMFIGKKFTMYSCIEIVLSSLLTEVIPSYPITNELLLLSVFGGIINATATCLCLFGDATTGGTDFIAIFMSERFNRDSWNYIFACNTVILTVAGLLFGWETALYSIIFQFASTQVLNVMYKRYQQQTMFIVTDKPDEVYDQIVKNTNHGATLFKGTGLYEQKERTMVYSVVSADEVKRVLMHVREADEKAFINCIKTDSLQGSFYRRPND